MRKILQERLSELGKPAVYTLRRIQTVIFKTVSPGSFLAKEELNNKDNIEERKRKTSICLFV